MKVFLGADHRGFALKEKIKLWLAQKGHQVTDCGNTTYDRDDDFPDFSFAVADEVAKDAETRGIVICGSGVGVTIAANKVKSIRASTALVVDEVRHGRAHDNLNVLAISSDYTSEEDAKAMISVFLETPFEHSERYTRRLKKIEEREK